MNQKIKNRIIKSFNVIKDDKNLYHITINPKKSCHIEDLIFKTKFFLREIARTFQYKTNGIKYLFVIEYSGKISKGISTNINRFGEHVHLILSTSLTLQQVEALFYSTFKGITSSMFEKIDDRTDKEGICGYILKQEKYFDEYTLTTNIFKFN